MDWFTILRVVVPGIIIGAIIGEVTVRKQGYYQAVDPRHWFDELKKQENRAIEFKILTGIALGIITLIIVTEVEQIVTVNVGQTVSPNNVHSNMQEQSMPLWILLIIPAVIVEEWVFRKVLIDELREKLGTWIVPVLVSSGLFTLLHLSNKGYLLPSLLPIFIGGLIYSLVYLRYGYGTVTITHLTYNLFPVILLLV